MNDLSKADWNMFCHIVKYKYRYFFHHENISDEKLLYAVRVIEDAAHELCNNLFTIESGSKLYRCRPEPSKFNTNDYKLELGPPPNEVARASRMSPCGISMFYLASDKETAILETADKDGDFGFAEFVLKRDIHVFDLCDLSQIQDSSLQSFIKDMIRDMVKPIVRDDRVHLEYIPTQIFTEQVTFNWSDNENRLIEGIKYPSSRDDKKANFVFFYDKDKYISDESPFELNEYFEERYVMRPLLK